MRVVKTNNQSIYGLTPEQEVTLRNHLTFDNPAYKNAKRYSRSRYITIPPYLTYYDTYKDGRERVMTVPVGVDLERVLKEKPDIEDKRNVVTVTYPEFVLTLRPDQQLAKNNYMAQQSCTYPKNLIHLPTGKGKTILALNLAYTLKQKTLILVHKDDLVTGWQKDIDLCFDSKVKSGLIKAKSRKVGEQITIATVQTLSRMSEEDFSSYVNQFGFVIQDEAHHVGLNIFNVIDKFNSKYKLGLSATPKRSDGLYFVFDLYLGGIGHVHLYTDDDKDILPVKVIKKTSNAHYEPFLYENQVFNAYDFNPEDLPSRPRYLSSMNYSDRPQVPFLTIDDSLVSNKKHKLMVCKDILAEYRQGHSCIAFFTQKEHIVSYFNYLKLFIPEDEILLYYGDNKEKTEVLMEKAESRKCLVTLATYAKATEGTNVKAWEVGFLVSSVNNEKNVEQAVGRIRRSCAGKIPTAILYDYRFTNSYSVSQHGFTRDKVYKKLKFTVESDIQGVISKSVTTMVSRSLFSRGF